MVMFLKNPAADAPWEEEEGSDSVIHIEDQKVYTVANQMPSYNSASQSDLSIRFGKPIRFFTQI